MKEKNNLGREILVFAAVILLVSILAAPMVGSYALEITYPSHMKDNKNNIIMQNILRRIIIVPDDYKTIQEAIDHANDGDIIFVREGTYKENIVVDKQVTINGSGYCFTIIDGGGGDNTVKVVRDGVAISFFSIQNSSSDNAGILVNSHYNTFSLNEVTGNGYGIMLDSSNGNKIFDNWIINNEMEGICIVESHMNNISGNNISGNGINGLMVNLSSTFNTLSGNIAVDNNLYGAVIDDGSRANTYVGNQLSINLVGVKGMGASDNNKFHHNDFKYNVHENANDSSNDTWSSVTEGNYWSDFDEPSEGAWDNDSNGIIDDPYFIPGGDNIDPFPLAGPTAPMPPNLIGDDEVKKDKPWDVHIWTAPPPNYDEVYYEIYWGNGDYKEDTGSPVNTTIGTDMSHTFKTQTTFNVKARAYVYIEGYRDYSEWSQIAVKVVKNNEKDFIELNDNFNVNKLVLPEEKICTNLKIKTAVYDKIRTAYKQTLDIANDDSLRILSNIYGKNIIISHFPLLSQLFQPPVFRKLSNLKL